MTQCSNQLESFSRPSTNDDNGVTLSNVSIRPCTKHPGGKAHESKDGFRPIEVLKVITTGDGGNMPKGISHANTRFVELCVPIVLLVSGCADLVVTEVHHEPFLTTARLIKATIKNEGFTQAPPSTTRLEVRPATATSFTRQATMQTPALNRGQQIELPMSQLSPTELPASGSGQCMELKVCADTTDAVFEGWLWEGNNCLTRSFCN